MRRLPVRHPSESWGPYGVSMDTSLRWHDGGVPSANFLLRLPFLLLIAAGLALAAQGAWIPAKAWAAQVLLDRAFAQGLAQREPVKAWPWADAAPVARISVPRLAVSEIVLSGGSGEALAFGPTHLPARHGRLRRPPGHPFPLPRAGSSRRRGPGRDCGRPRLPLPGRRWPGRPPRFLRPVGRPRTRHLLALRRHRARSAALCRDRPKAEVRPLLC
jgi:hypothetical protein